MAVLTDTNIFLRLLQPHRARGEELNALPLTEEWERIVKLHSVSGKNTHDARLVAAMRVHGIRSILTFNAKAFVRYQDVIVLEPTEISQ
jgi:predicted nucleic acid-binding protein